MKPPSAEFLLEIGCEEIPAGMIANASAELKVILDKYFSAEKLLLDADVTAFGAPRRLVATCPKLPLKQEDVTLEVVGPPKAIAFDAEGRPTRAAESFAGKQGVAVSDLYIVSTPRGEYVATKQLTPGRASAERLNEILPRAIAEISWPRTMYWTGAAGFRFIRPIRWVVALLGGKPLNFAIDDVKVPAPPQQGIASWARRTFPSPISPTTSRSCALTSCWRARTSAARKSRANSRSFLQVKVCA